MTTTLPAPAAGGGPATETPRCTDRINYAGDPRSNAEINSIGQQTGQCPVPITGRHEDTPVTPPAPAPAETPRCTDQNDYTGDPRSNAEINSIGQQTGQCPVPIHSWPGIASAATSSG